MNTSRREVLERLPPSAKLVYKALEWNDRLTQQGIAEETMLSGRTVRYALTRLEKADLVDETLYIPDARQSMYSLCEASE